MRTRRCGACRERPGAGLERPGAGLERPGAPLAPKTVTKKQLCCLTATGCRNTMWLGCNSATNQQPVAEIPYGRNVTVAGMSLWYPSNTPSGSVEPLRIRGAPPDPWSPPPPSSGHQLIRLELHRDEAPEHVQQRPDTDIVRRLDDTQKPLKWPCNGFAGPPSGKTGQSAT